MSGLTVVITADRRSQDLANALRRHGASVVHTPALTIVPHEFDDDLAAATRALLADPPEVSVVTTGVGFRGWYEAADAAGMAEGLVSVLRASRILARGPKARGALLAAGLVPDWVASSETSAELGDALLLEDLRGRHIAVQYHGSGDDGLTARLVAAGARVSPLVVYRWGPPPDLAVLLDGIRRTATGEIDIVVFTSAPGASAWLTAAEEAGALGAITSLADSGQLTLAAVGAVTAGPLRAQGLDPLVPERGRLGALVRAVVASCSEARAVGLVTRAGRLRLRSATAILDGRPLPLSGTSLRVLRLLVEADGRVVDRDQVLTVLPSGAEDRHRADAAVHRLRTAVGDPRLIQTVIKRGYRLAVD